MTYTTESIERYLRQYLRMAAGGKLPQREDRLASKPPPTNEAPWASSARIKADLEMALKALPFETMALVMMAYIERGDQGYRGCWEPVAKMWGTTGAEARARARNGVRMMVGVLNEGSSPGPEGY